MKEEISVLKDEIKQINMNINKKNKFHHQQIAEKDDTIYKLMDKVQKV